MCGWFMKISENYFHEGVPLHIHLFIVLLSNEMGPH